MLRTQAVEKGPQTKGSTTTWPNLGLDNPASHLALVHRSAHWMSLAGVMSGGGAGCFQSKQLPNVESQGKPVMTPLWMDDLQLRFRLPNWWLLTKDGWHMVM
jgi:hypothetical protein